MSKGNKIKIWLPSVLFFLCLEAPGYAQQSGNVVGYINLNVNAGYNLIANDFSGNPDNTIDSVLTSGVVAGSTFSLWNTVTQTLMPASTFNGTSWSIDYDLPPDGVGGVLNSPSATTVTFSGAVLNVDVNNNYTFVPPNYAPGIYLLGMAAPLTGTFQQIVGRGPNNGDSVVTFDPATGTFPITTYITGSWNNGTPNIPVGEAAYFELVPEPSPFMLSGFGAAIFLGFRCFRSRFSRHS